MKVGGGNEKGEENVVVRDQAGVSDRRVRAHPDPGAPSGTCLRGRLFGQLETAQRPRPQHITSNYAVTMSAFQQAAQDGVCLRNAQELAPVAQCNHDVACTMLLRGHDLAASQPFVWGYIDKPQGDHQTF